MNARRSLLPLLLSLAGVALIVSVASGQLSEGEKLYESGVYQMEAVGNFEEAIALFDRVAKEYRSNEALAAKALLKLGLCYERLGSQKAEEAYNRIINQFPGQPAQVAEARARLAALQEQKESVGQSIQISSGDASVTSLCLSPDGTKMAVLDYSIGQNIGYYDVSTKKVELVTRYHWEEGLDAGWTNNASWSPDGKELAYWKGEIGSDSGGVWVSTLDGNARWLYGRAAARMALCQWLPDASGIVTVIADSAGYSLGVVSTKGDGFRILRSMKDVGMDTRVAFSVASVSPDGRFIAFQEGPEGAGDIRLISIDGKKLTALTEHPADDVQPLWSPEGGHVVFRSNRHGDWALWGVSVRDGSPHGDPFMIAAGMDAQLLNWTPAGLAYSRLIALADIYRVPVDPSSGKTLGNPELISYTPTGSNVAPAWSPDGKHLAFVSNRGGGLASPGYLVVIPADGGASREFRVPFSYTYWTWFFQDLRWTPDGKTIGFTGVDTEQERQIYRLSLETGKWETWPLAVPGMRIEWDKDPESYILGTVVPDDRGDRGIVKCSHGKSETVEIYRGGRRSTFRGLRCSRDYQWIAFQLDGTTVVAVDRTTGDSHVVAADGYRMCGWSPDGSRMLVSKWREGDICVVGRQGGTLEGIGLLPRMPKGVEVRALDWSPGGKEIAICANSWIATDYLIKKVIPEEQH